jgi:hypothetical protein
MTRSRTIRLDISPSIYNVLEWNAIEKDMGISDIIRRVVIEWCKSNPVPANVDVS